MKQWVEQCLPEGGSWRRTVFIWLVVTLWFAGVVWFDWPGCVTNDTKRQLMQGIAGHYDNWKPALYSWMLGGAHQLWEGHAVPILFMVQLLIMGLAVGGIAHYYSLKRGVYGLLVLVLPLFFTTKVMLVSTVGNDAMAAACYLLFIAGVLWVPLVKGRIMKIVGWGMCWLVLAVGLSMRHNAAPAVLILLFWSGHYLGITHRFWRVVISAIVLLSMLFANFIFTDNVLKVSPCYPLKSPLANDVVNISILQGKWEPICQHYAETPLPPPHEFAELRAEAANGGVPINPFLRHSDLEIDRYEYLFLMKGWWKSLKAHPKQYVALKLFFFHQFLMEGRCIPWVTDALKLAYPHIRVGMDEESRKWRSWVNREFVGMSLIPLACYFVLFIAFMKRILLRQAYKHSLYSTREGKDALYMIATAFIYTCTFLLLVPSATEQRYYIIRASLTCVAGALLLLSALEPKVKARIG